MEVTVYKQAKIHGPTDTGEFFITFGFRGLGPRMFKSALAAKQWVTRVLN